MTDVNRRDAALHHHAAKRLQHFHLRGHIQRGSWFIKDHHVRIANQRHRRHQTLQLTARHLVREAVANGLGVGQRQFAEQLNRFGFCRFAGQGAVDNHRLNHLVEDLHARIKRRCRALGDISDFVAAKGAQLPRRQAVNVGAGNMNVAVGDAAAAAGVTHQRHRDSGFT